MPLSRISSFGLATLATGGAALTSWAFALAQAMPRLLAGPLCSSRSDAWSLAGHCPACFAAVGFSLAFLGLLAGERRVWIAERIGLAHRIWQ